MGFDVDAARCRDLAASGGEVASSPAAVADQTGRVVLSLMTSAIVQQVIEGADGILSAGRLPRCIVDTTTGDPAATAALAARQPSRPVATPIDSPGAGG